MPAEVELKFLDLSKDEIDALQEKILSLGGILDYSGILKAVYFDTSDELLKRQGGALRLRSEPLSNGGERVVLTRKINKHEAGVKSCEERETVVDSFSTTAAILTSLQYSEVLVITKHRSSYMLDGGRVEIETHKDDLAHIPPFIELESSSREALFALATTLGLDPEKGEALNAFDIQRHYSVKK